MTFLVPVAARVVEWFLVKFGLEIYEWIKVAKQRDEIKKQANLDANAIKNANSSGEAQTALQKAIDRIFNRSSE